MYTCTIIYIYRHIYVYTLTLRKSTKAQVKHALGPLNGCFKARGTEPICSWPSIQIWLVSLCFCQCFRRYFYFFRERFWLGFHPLFSCVSLIIWIISDVGFFMYLSSHNLERRSAGRKPKPWGRRRRRRKPWMGRLLVQPLGSSKQNCWVAWNMFPFSIARCMICMDY